MEINIYVVEYEETTNSLAIILGFKMKNKYLSLEMRYNTYTTHQVNY